MWSANFLEAFILKLAYSQCYDATGSAALRKDIGKDFEFAWKLARSQNAKEGLPKISGSDAYVARFRNA
jgi:hypothetical protein